jgi:signal transduction histidine kinase
MNKYFRAWRGFTAQLFLLTILPLTLLLLAIALGSVYLHQQDMRALVGERDERAIQSASAAVSSELHHRATTISDIAMLVNVKKDFTFDDLADTGEDTAGDFDGGLALLDFNKKHPVAVSRPTGLWDWALQNRKTLSLASPSNFHPVFSSPFLDPTSNQTFVIISMNSSSGLIVAGAFSPETLAVETLSASYPSNARISIYLIDSSQQLLFVNGTHGRSTLPSDFAGVGKALEGQNGIGFVQLDNTEHVVAYAPIPSVHWALLSDEAWETVVSPSLQVTQMAPLVLVPAFLLALIALWFGARRIVRPLQKLEAKAAALAWGNFDAIKEPVDGISEVQHLQQELTEMARKVQTAQNGLHDYIGAITTAQEEERQRLAHELHDDTIQAVIALKQRVQLAQKSIKTQSGHQALNELETLAEQTIENLRRLTRALRPIYLEDLGLVTALEMLAREMSQSNHVEVDFQKNGQERRLPGEVELVFYRIAQEALNNVVRHAKAGQAMLQIIFGEGDVKLEVNDNGVGFQVSNSPTDFAPSGHFGLLGMHERAELIGARLEVRSETGKGTRLSVHIPIASNGSK